MSYAPKCGLGLSKAFWTSSNRRQILSRPLFSVIPTAFFLFWVKLWVRLSVLLKYPTISNIRLIILFSLEKVDRHMSDSGQRFLDSVGKGSQTGR